MRKGEELKAPRYASAAITRDYITICDIIPNTFFIILIGQVVIFYYNYIVDKNYSFNIIL